MYLLDTNVVSELRRVRPHGAVLAGFDRLADEDIHLSAVTAGEIQASIEITRVRDAAKAAEIERWLQRLMDAYNFLPMDAHAFRKFAQLMKGRSGHLASDAMIAATAEVHNLVVATRNVQDFDPFGVRTFNPFA
jgi:predicted nucleic acid-binding protein